MANTELRHIESVIIIFLINERRFYHERNYGIYFFSICWNLFLWWYCSFTGRKGALNMDGFGNFISMLDFVLDTKRKRHITGGILLSASLLFGGLALTVMTINNEEDIDEQ